MQKSYLATVAMLAAAMTAGAHTTLLDQNFDQEWRVDFPIVLELDHKAPAPSINPLFQNSDGVSEPWWPLRDSNSSTDRFLGSHSYYQGLGTSNDWIGSRAIYIPSEGFTLSFGAQSYVVRKDGDRLSDLWLFITEEQLSADNLPTDPTMVYSEIPWGTDNGTIEKDFIPYELSLDPWIGKTIYINFANLNTDKDLLLLDNVLVQRLDRAELSLETPAQYILNGDFEVTATVTGTVAPGIGAWTMTFDDGKGEKQTFSGSSVALGESVSHKFTSKVEADSSTEFTVTLSGEGFEPISTSGAVTGLAFEPEHRVLFEETTGTWCGNCPLGAYTIQSLMLDEETKDKVVPISIHIEGGAPEDYMVNVQYAGLFGVTSAPMYRIERDMRVNGFTNYDANFDLSNPMTVGYAVLQRAKQSTLAAIDLDARYIIQGEDTTSVRCTARVTPAVTLPAGYAVGFVMTENNVCNYGTPYSRQANYFSGADFASKLGGWTLLPRTVANMRFQDVARGVWGYRGLAGSLGDGPLAVNETVEVTTEIEIPNTFQQLVPGDPSTVTSLPIARQNVVMVAYIINTETGLVLNAAACPMSDVAEDRFTIMDLVNEASVDSIISDDPDAPTFYYNLQGIRIDAPVEGEPCIVRKGASAKKVIF